MNKLLFSRLKLNDTTLKNSLYESKDYKQVLDILKTFEGTIDSQIQDLENHVDAQKLLDELHRYNDIKDMTQVLLGSLAIIRGVTVAQLHRDFDLEI